MAAGADNTTTPGWPVSETKLGSGTYRPLVEIGRGGMARVYLAERNAGQMRKFVVLKVIEPLLATSPEMRANFRREATLCARLNHPNIVQVFEFHDDTDLPMMVMEYVEGISLAEIRSRLNGNIPLRIHAHIISQTLGALHYFHELRNEQGEAEAPVHRDVSPQNVLVMHEGVVKVLDFGIAKVRGAAAGDTTETGIFKGKLAYMPPEQVRGDKTIDRRADIFAAGVMLWEAFAGRRMWRGRVESELLASLFEGVIPRIQDANPDVSEVWKRIIDRAVANARNDRYITALEMQIDIENALAELGGPVPQRELSDFMKANFGAQRTEQQQRIAAATREVAVFPANLPPQPEVDRTSLTVTSLSSGRTVGGVLRPSRWARIASFAAPLILVGVGLYVVNTSVASSEDIPAAAPISRSHQERLQAQPPERLITVSIAATPPQATVRFNGKPVGANPWFAQMSANDQPAYVEIAAPGHLPFAEEVNLSEDVVLTIQLKPDAAQLAAPQSPTPTKPTATPKVRRPAPTNSPRKCSPPYSVDASGIKTFKPECL